MLRAAPRARAMRAPPPEGAPYAAAEGGAGTRGLAERCGELRERVAALQQALPLVQSPTPAEVREALGSDDVQCTELPLPGGRRLGVAFLETLVNEQRLWDEVFKPLTQGALQLEALPEAETLHHWRELLHHLLLGYALLLPTEGPPRAFAAQGLQQRSVGPPTTERQIVGPKEAFVERLETNLGLIRNRLRDPALRIELRSVGRRSRTRVAMIYLRDVADPELVERTRAGLAEIAVDFVRTAMDVAELTFQHGWTTFPLVEQTERPDRVAHALSHGRLALVVEGAPFVLVVPVTLFDFQHDGEAALPGPAVSTFVRSLRFAGSLVALSLPGLYVALLSANPSLLPTRLSITLASARFAVPYPVATETVLMLLAADILAEATAQSAPSIGNALSIVGTLIVGQLMVQAHLASTLLMIIIAASVMGSFLTLKFTLSYAMRIWKYAVVALAAVGGMVGWFTGLLVLLVHLASLESAGTPYLSPLAAARSPAAVAHITTQSSRPRERLRPPEYRPRDRVSARRGGRR